MISLVEWVNAGSVSAETIGVLHSIRIRHKNQTRGTSMELVRRLWSNQEGQDIAEYAVMLAVILVIVVGTVRLIGSNANNVFSSVASSIQ